MCKRTRSKQRRCVSKQSEKMCKRTSKQRRCVSNCKQAEKKTSCWRVTKYNHPYGIEDEDSYNFLDAYRDYFDILVDPEKLSQLFGKDGINKDLGVNIPKFEDVPADFENGQRRGKDLVYLLKLPLQDLHFGASKKLSLSRNVLCSMCNGKGTKSGAPTKCIDCQGSGAKVSLTQIGRNFFSKDQSRCLKCNGTGEFVDDNDRCHSCKGKKVVTKKKVLEVHVEKGMPIGHRITFPGQADEAPDTITGDLVFVLRSRNSARRPSSSQF